MGIVIKEIVKKPSDALQAMVNGLKNQSQRSDFIIDMMDWGSANLSINMCFGCAATCTIQEISGKNILPEHYFSEYFHLTRAKVLGFTYITEVDEFEKAINYARGGNMGRLFAFFGINELNIPVTDFYLDTNNWETELPKVEEYINNLKILNL